MINLTGTSGETSTSFGSPFPGQGVPFGAATGRTANFGYSALGSQGRGTGKFGSQRPVLSAQMNAAPPAVNLGTPAEAMQGMQPANLSDEQPQAGPTTINQHFQSGAQPPEHTPETVE